MVSNAKALILVGAVMTLMIGAFMINQDKMAAYAAILENTSNAEAINSAVSAFQEIGTLRRANPIDAGAIRDVYVNSLQALTQEVDASNDLTLDSDMLAAIDEISADNEPRLAAQVIDKTLQRVFYLTILDRVTTVRDEFDTASTETLNATWDEAMAAFEAIKGTAARENKVISANRQSIETGDNPALDVQIAMAFERGRAALSKLNPSEDLIEIRIVRQIIRLSLVRAYYIGVLREVEGVVSNRDRDIEEAREKQKEGEIFYRLIEGFITRENATGSEFIKDQFTGNIASVDANAIVSELSKGFIGRVRAELDANESSISDDRGRAMEVAEEALLYANTFLADLEIRLDSNARSEIETALNSLRDASSASDAASAEQARQEIDSVLVTYAQTLAVAEYEQTAETPFVDAAVTAFQTVGSLRRQNPVDAQAVLDAYTGELQQLTQIVDSIYRSSMDSDILAAINDISNGQQVPLAAQVIDKTLQRVFALTIYNRVTYVLELFDDLSIGELELEWDRAYSAFQAVKGTAARENKVLTADRQSIESGSNPFLDSRITLALIGGKAAIDNAAPNSQAQLAIAREQVILPLVRGFLIGVLREVEGIVENRDRDIDEALEKQVEGIYFYRIVEPVIAVSNPNSNARIQSQLTGDLFAVNADQIVSDISRGVIGQINSHLAAYEQSFDSDRTQAGLAATVTALYTQMLLPDLGLRLDATKRVKIENALQDLIEASEQDDQSKAQNAQLTITEIISEYENELI
ncbi:hypothetical protein SAMN05421690_101438 [Nitrosomonas sp. Nm51]|uniref:hypothetical protein n=1 Tax=Nitrosomonas sp. Nm51 TaxID=133720 RepID=UPI0008AF7C62|nr:hypothetical protein [Nitrosomonas sp. Nm51]SER24879.1 hypothetical protein SAMN05421690_101438 [Nitrosomonas sp. Nm51]